MTETEFLTLANASLQAIETALERCSDELDTECTRSGNVLEIELIDNASKIIVNLQTPMQQVWVAARAGGYHFTHDGQVWRDTRDQSELFSTLSNLISGQAGVKVDLAA